MRAVITGGTGFLGSHLINQLIKKGYEIACLSRGATDTSYIESIGVPIIQANITDRENIEKNIKEGDVVFHIAAILGAAKTSAEKYNEINIKGTINVLEAAIKKKAGSFIFISSLAAMGPVGSIEKPMNENTPCHPDSLYGESKLEAEKKIHEIAKGKIPCVILRPSIIYGPRTNSLSAAFMLFNNMRKKTFVIIGNTKNYFSICYVKNLVAAMVYFAEKHKTGIHTYLITDDQSVRLEDILMHLRKGFGVNKRIIHIPYWLPYSVAFILELAGKVFRCSPLLSRDIVRGIAGNVYCHDLSKAINNGYKPAASLAEGIQETVEWIKAQG